jgi:hypothetical protein
MKEKDQAEHTTLGSSGLLTDGSMERSTNPALLHACRQSAQEGMDL